VTWPIPRGKPSASGARRGPARTRSARTSCSASTGLQSWGYASSSRSWPTAPALFAGSFLGMKELGFALAVGVLLDTLVVRPILVPTFWILLQRRRGGAAESGSRTSEQPDANEPEGVDHATRV
jgi:hypothetical protein